MDDNIRVPAGMGGGSLESSQAQPGHIFSLERAGKIVRQISSPGDGAIFQGNIIGVTDVETGSVMRFNRNKHLGRAIVKEAAFVFRPAIQLHGHIFQTHILNVAVRRAIDADAVFGEAGDVLKLDVAHRSQFRRRQARDGRQ